METRSLLPPPWPQLESLLEAGEVEGFRFLRRLRDELASGRGAYASAGEALLGAFEGERLVALCGLVRDPFAGDPRVGRVRHLYVVPDARRRGVARALLAAVERAAAEHYDALHLRTDTDAADRFYRAAGWCAHDAPTATHRRELGPGPAP